METGAEPAEVVALGLELTKRGPKVFGCRDVEAVEESAAAGGERIPRETKASRDELDLERAGAIGCARRKAPRKERDERRGEPAGDMKGIDRAEADDQRLARIQRGSREIAKPRSGTPGARALDEKMRSRASSGTPRAVRSPSRSLTVVTPPSRTGIA